MTEILMGAAELAAWRKDYERGWRYSGRETATLDHLDAIGASSARYDGYLDYAVGREKWHALNCADPGCDCGAAILRRKGKIK
jgi:hypothetical protein